MKTESEKLSPTRVKLTVEVPFDELKPAIEAATKKIADQVQIPGFRKGKVPSKLVEQRFGRPAILQEAVNDSLPDFYQQAAAEVELKPVGRPEVEVAEVPGLDGEEEGNLVFTVEQDVRPEISLPDFSTYEVEIEEPEVDEDAVEVRLTELRERFGTLVGVDRPAEDGDFVSLDMIATIDDEEIESVEGVSYQIGEGNMLEGLDEALTGLSAEETTTFASKLAGGDRAGEEAQVKVTAQSVKVRELPEADDEFAEMASEFDTIDELKDDLKKQAAADAEGNRVALARNALLEKLLEELEIPVPEQLVEDEILSHLENEGKEAGDPHGEEIREDTEKAVRAQFLLDEINGTREVQVDQSDLMNYMTQLSAQYGIEPNQLLQMLAQSGQLEQIFSEVQRSKALDVVLADITVKNASGDVLDLGLTADDAGEKAEDEPSEKAEAAEKAPAKKAPAKKAPAKKPAAKKAAAKDEAAEATSEDAEEKPAKKSPAKKAPAKKAPAKKPAAKKAAAKDEAAEATDSE
ncbi:trigger factor [Brachybacterium faecium DSM 4810]|uniref:Trigger factor n=1 Tax=Brachybacterium faecium (strain ATCC 43885 / DSM 4810 / JCM 11609 / LMG 19847 / NBRC 14762 / NCIMB 9860 / 6-10) TaxID=446465 RepID=C7MAP5_BRAFD|nr:trigger factor [Brachybacterium faecium]ACU84803.1 trigger factor [Brachybacterium faecium DSM 4810]